MLICSKCHSPNIVPDGDEKKCIMCGCRKIEDRAIPLSSKTPSEAKLSSIKWIMPSSSLIAGTTDGIVKIQDLNNSLIPKQEVSLMKKGRWKIDQSIKDAAIAEARELEKETGRRLLWPEINEIAKKYEVSGASVWLWIGYKKEAFEELKKAVDAEDTEKDQSLGTMLREKLEHFKKEAADLQLCIT